MAQLNNLEIAKSTVGCIDLLWSSLDQRAVDTVRVLAADAVEKVGNGHPGTAMSLTCAVSEDDAPRSAGSAGDWP